MIGKVNDACPNYMTFINIEYLFSRIQQFKLRENLKKWLIPIDVNVDVAQKLTKMSYTKFNSLYLKKGTKRKVQGVPQ